jgi:LuxR family maltose regulon positive regulatory protein
MQMIGDIDGAAKIIKNELAKNAWPDAMQAKLMHYLSLACIQEGDLNGVLQAGHAGLRIAEKLYLPETLGWCRYDLGIAHYLRNELAQAEPYLLALLENRYSTPATYLTSGVFALALIYLHQGRNSEIGQVIGLLEATFQEMNEKSALAMTAAIKVELLLRENRLEEAQSFGQGIEYDLIPPHWLLYVPQLTYIRLLSFEESSESLREARAKLELFDENMRRIKRNNVRIDVLVLLSLVCDRQGDESSAFENMSIALDLGSIGGNIRTFVDLGKPMANLLRRLKIKKVVDNQTAYLNQLLAAFPETLKSPTTALQSQLDEPLTDRELEVLTLLAKRLSNKEIAAKLVISPRTVKRHTLNIYRKLGVNSRQQAVEKVAELGILA